MKRSDRLALIIQMIDEAPRTIADLAMRTGVSPISIRRDLRDLAEKGAVTRVRGGAERVPVDQPQHPVQHQLGADADVERRLARAVTELISPGDAVLLDSGTTAQAVAQELAGLGVTVLALSLHAAVAAASKPGNRVIVPGGPVDENGLGFTSAEARDTVESMRFDVAILSAFVGDSAAGLTVADWGDAQVKRTALTVSRRPILVVTADMFTRTAAHWIGSVHQVDTLITTDGVTPRLVYEAQSAGVKMIIVEP